MPDPTSKGLSDDANWAKAPTTHLTTHKLTGKRLSRDTTTKRRFNRNRYPDEGSDTGFGLEGGVAIAFRWYRIPITIDDKTDFLDATVFDKAATQLLEIPCKEMFTNVAARTAIHNKITAKPVQFTIRAIRDDCTALTSYSVNNAIFLQLDKTTDITSSSANPAVSTLAPFTAAPTNSSVNEKKKMQVQDANCLTKKV
ncbi:hypothetical protein M8C21_025697 [Ambrosia artemisiifolia]|uniref:Uncharacterized protein n=1 Tax=Ambrosia artemisiifolia TaxID=4212 RepID=A0AAD5C7Q4_AMBAR|nr:hypothetical protein M8C21_025697 [Ambrosia artemisiifolia]